MLRTLRAVTMPVRNHCDRVTFLLKELLETETCAIVLDLLPIRGMY